MCRRFLLSPAAICLLAVAVRVDGRQPKEVRPFPAGAILQLTHEGKVHDAVYSPDGKALATVAEGRVSLWDAVSGRQLWQINLPDRNAPRCLAFAPDGKTLAGCGDFGLLAFWAVATGKQRQLNTKPASSSWTAAFSPDGKHLATGGLGELSLWDGRTGKQLRSLERRRGPIAHVAFSPDSKVLAASGQNNYQIECWDPAAGKFLRAFQDDGNALGKGTFSPDGKQLAALTYASAVRLWNWETGKEVRTLAGAPQKVAVYTFAFSPDGHSIALAQWNIHTLLIYETATGLERARFSGHTDRLMTVSFASHGRALATSSLDRSVCVWDVTGRWRDGKWRAPKLSEAELAGLWSDLGGKQADKAYQAVWTLALSPEQGVPFLGSKFFYGDGPEPRKLTRLIGELDDDRPVFREKAFAELKRLGPTAVNALYKAAPQLPESKARVKQLLDPKHADPMPGADRLQLARAMEALELAATPLARRILEDQTVPIREDWIAEEARAALKRLSR